MHTRISLIPYPCCDLLVQPFLFNTALQTVVTFDDTKSIGLKSAYALKSGIGGVGFWDMTGDPHSILTNVARAQLGKK